MISTAIMSRLEASSSVCEPWDAMVDIPHPDWLVVLLGEVRRYQRAIQECPIVVDLSNGTFLLPQAQDCLIQLYPFVKTFPDWISLNRDKVSDRETRVILERFVNVLRRHEHQWIYMAEGFGVHRQELFEAPIRLKVEALNQYMWLVSRRRTLAEGMISLGYAMGSLTCVIAPSLFVGFTQYEKRTGQELGKKAFSWVRSQARSHDKFIRASLEITKQHVFSKFEQESVKEVAIRSLAYLLMALEECGAKYDPWNSYRRVRHRAA